MSTPPDKPILLVALGGNAFIRQGQAGTISEQMANLRVPLGQIARLCQSHRIIITHGNGPQVGDLLLRQECCPALPALPLEILVAQTQGQIGYMIESTLDGELTALGLDVQKPLVSLISYVVVDPADPAFGHPTKPIGPVLDLAQQRAATYPTMSTPKGPRRVVASPLPITIVERREIRLLMDLDFIVICCGGGGIPVVREGRGFAGVDAVIDKDLASAKLAEEVGVEVFCIATDVPGVALDYGQATERIPPRFSLAQAERYLSQGQFPPGSMGPKVQACMNFLRAGGRRAVICALEEIAPALAGQAGTEITRS